MSEAAETSRALARDNLFSGTNAKKPALVAGFFALTQVVEADFRRDCASNPKVWSRHRRARMSEAAETSRAIARDNLFSGTINKKRHPKGCLFLLIRITERSGLSTRLRQQSESAERRWWRALERYSRRVAVA